MRTTAAVKLTVFFVASLLLGAILAPWLFLAGKSLVANGTLGGGALHGLHDALERSPFSRYFNRAMLIGALVALVPTVRWMRIRRSDLGLESNPWNYRDLFSGFVLAAGGLALLGVGLVWLGCFKPEESPGWGRVPGALASGFAVGFLEEFVFRGALLGLLLKTMRKYGAIFFLSAFFAVIHYLKPPDLELAASEVDWSTGFMMLGKLFERFTEWQSLVGILLTLFAVSWVLCEVRMRTRSLWLPVGLHAGWVFGLKTFGAFTDKTPKLRGMMPWVGGDLRSGVAPLVTILITSALVFGWIRWSRNRHCVS